MLPTICPASLIPVAEEPWFAAISGVRFVMAPFCQSTARPGEPHRERGVADDLAVSFRAFAMADGPPSVPRSVFAPFCQRKARVRRVADHLARLVEFERLRALHGAERAEVGDDVAWRGAAPRGFRGERREHEQRERGDA